MIKNKKMTAIILIITATLTALIAGLFYAYSCSVNIGLRRLPDNEYVAAMQAINDAILNPVFFMSFIGTLLFLPISVYLSYEKTAPMQFWILLFAAAFYIIGVFGVTVVGNVPLNDALAAVDLKSATPDEITGARLNFEGPWNLLHTIRTVFSVLSLILVLLACVYDFKK